jgi:saccharopepsin
MIIVSPLLLALLPFVTASRLHKLKLHKVAPAANNPALESAYLAEKYGAPPQIQMPLIGLGGSGRRLEHEQLFWTQEELKGGHNVPLTSLLHTFGFVFPLTPRFFRFHECPVLHRDQSGTTPTNCTSV